MPQEATEIDFDVVHVTADAVRVSEDILQGEDVDQPWIPQSQIHNIDDFDALEIGGSYTLEVTTWWAEKEGLI